jgi:predicted small secreted protein
MSRIVLSLSFLFALAACETTQGVGQDIEDTGEFIEDAVE